MARRTTPAEVVAKERQVLDLRRAGLSFDLIAERLKYGDRSAAHKAFQRALERTVPDVGVPEARSLEVARLDRLLTALWPGAMKGDLATVDRVLKIQERLARLQGLDVAPVKAEPSSDPPAADPLDELGARRAARHAEA